MARPKRRLIVNAGSNPQPVQKMNKIEEQKESLLVENGGLVNGSRKRKIATVAPMVHVAAEKKNAFSKKDENNTSDSPVKSKKGRETLKKRVSKGKKVVKRKKNMQQENEPKKPQYCLTVPKLPNLGATEALAVGTGDTGQLGLGEDTLEKSRPVPITAITESVIDIAAGGMHSVCLTASGKVYTFGCNDDGTLGRLTEEEEENFTPGIVELPEKVVQISAGDTHTAALTETGHVFVWGNFRDSTGLMGLTPNGQKEPLPVKVLVGVPCASVASGAEHLVCLGVDGQLYTMGNGEQGQLGRISQYSNARGGRKGLSHILSPGLVHFQRSKSLQNYPPEFDHIWAGAYCTYARERHTGTIFGFGLNNYFQLGENEEGTANVILFMPTRLKTLSGCEWKMLSGGNHHVVALDSSGKVYTWGRQDDGRLGLGEVKEEQSKPVTVPLLKDIKCSHIATGSTTTYAITEDGQLYSWGFGENYQLGHGDTEDSQVPKLVESKTMKTRTALKVDGGGQHTLILATKRDQTS